MPTNAAAQPIQAVVTGMMSLQPDGTGHHENEGNINTIKRSPSLGLRFKR
jgi:hypothetical protein